MVKLSLGFVNNFAMKMYKEMKVLLHACLTLAVVGVEWLASCPGHFTPKEGPQCPFCGGAGWVPEPVWTREKEEKNLFIVPGMEVRFLGFPAITLVSCYEVSIPFHELKRQQTPSASKIE